MTLPRPKRRKPVKMMVRDIPQARCPGHLKWVRGHECAAFSTLFCSGGIEAAHVRIGTDGGTGVKPGDNWAVPLCAAHHFQQHQIGEKSFEEKFRINMKAIAESLWLISPHGKAYRARNLIP